MKLHGNARDLTNQRFGKLVALYPTEKRQQRSIVWHCICDCGNEVNITSKNLTYGSSQSCGCAYSLGETHIKAILDAEHIPYKKEYCITVNGKKMRFDFAILTDKKVTRLVEFDGPHHSVIKTQIYSEEKCKAIQDNDLIKNQWAKDNHIPLVRIPYSQRDKITFDTIFSNKFLI